MGVQYLGMNEPVNGSRAFSPPSTIVDEVVRVLTVRIIHGELPPNTRLIEENLAQEFGISRPPIRESFRALEREGLVTITPRKGVRVKAIESREVEEIYECRSALSSLAVRLASQRMNPRTADTLGQIVREMFEAARDQDLDTYVSLNIAFHDLVGVAAGNETLRNLIRSLGTRVWRFRYLSLSPPHRMQRSAELHEELLGALVVGDGERAETLGRRIIEEAHIALSAILEEEAAAKARGQPLQELSGSAPR